MMLINMFHKRLTDQKAYEQMKKIYKENPKCQDVLLNPEEWKRLRLIELRKGRKIWSQ